MSISVTESWIWGLLSEQMSLGRRFDDLVWTDNCIIWFSMLLLSMSHTSSGFWIDALTTCICLEDYFFTRVASLGQVYRLVAQCLLGKHEVMCSIHGKKNKVWLNSETGGFKEAGLRVVQVFTVTSKMSKKHGLEYFQWIKPALTFIGTRELCPILIVNFLLVSQEVKQNMSN